MRHYISYFLPPITNKVPAREISTEDLFREITTSEPLRNATQQVRDALARGDNGAYKSLKTHKLPLVTPAGVFSYAKTDALEVPSGLMVIDVDHLPSHEAACQLRDRCFQDSWLRVELAFVSPSGLGVKLFIPYSVPVDAPLGAYYREYMELVWVYLRATYDVEPDTSGTDLSRGCLLCHDSDARFRPYELVVPKLPAIRRLTKG